MFLFIDFSFNLSPRPPLRRRGGDVLLKDSAFLARLPSPVEKGWGRGYE